MDGGVLGNHRMEGNYRQPPPGAVIHRADTGQKVRKQDQRVGLCDILGGAVFFLNGQLVGGGQLFQDGAAEPLVLLQLCSDDQPFASQRG